MKILQVTPRYPPQLGGVETHVKEISERLADRGHKVTVISVDAGMKGKQREVRNGISVRRYRSISPNGAIHLCPQIAAVVRRANVDVVHAHNYHSFPLFFAALGAGDRKFVVTTHYHGGSASLARDQLLSLYRPLGRWAVRRADEVIAVSEWEKKQLTSDLGVDATVIPNGVNLERFTEAEPFVWNRPYLLVVGRLEEYKGVQHVIHSLVHLPEYDLLIAGSGPHRAELEQIARDEEVADRVEFLGYVDDDKLPGLYAGAEVYVTMSKFEAYGITVAEALTAGTPCLVRKVGGLRDWTDVVGVKALNRITPEMIAQSIQGLRNTPTESQECITWEDTTDILLQKAYNLVPTKP